MWMLICVFMQDLVFSARTIGTSLTACICSTSSFIKSTFKGDSTLGSKTFGTFFLRQWKHINDDDDNNHFDGNNNNYSDNKQNNRELSGTFMVLKMITKILKSMKINKDMIILFVMGRTVVLPVLTWYPSTLTQEKKKQQNNFLRVSSWKKNTEFSWKNKTEPVWIYGEFLLNF